MTTTRRAAPRGPRPRLLIGWPLAMALLLCGAPAAGQQAGVLSGTVITDATGEPIPGARIQFEHAAWTGAAISAEDGSYRMPAVPAGRGLLRVRHIGHHPFEVEVQVADGRELVVDLALAVRPVALEPVTVEADRLRTGTGQTQMGATGVGRATIRVIDTSPGIAEAGLLDAALQSDGGDDPMDPGSILYVRGAASDLKLVHLDGAPVYAPFPLGGLLDPFAPDLLNRADVYLGGAPARYDGGLSYLMDLRTRGATTTGLHTSGSLDLLSATALAEAGFGGRFGVIASVRGMHPLSSSAILADRLPYDYREGLLRTDIVMGPVTRLSLTGFANREAVWMAERSSDARTIDWGNDAGSLRLQTEAARHAIELTAGFGDYRAQLPLGGSTGMIAEGSARRSRLALDLVRSTRDAIFRYGTSYDGQSYRAVAGSPLDGPPARVLESAGSVTGAYGEMEVQPDRSVSLRAGMRIDHFSTSRELAVAPRLAATWMISEGASVRVAAGRYRQFLRAPDQLLLSSDPAHELEFEEGLIVGSASHFTAGFHQAINDHLGLGMDAFYKRFSDVPSAGAAVSNASGVDLWVDRDGAGVTGWFGYSLQWVWSAAAGPGQSDFSGRHLLNTGVSLPIDHRTKLDLRFAYGAGIAYAGIPVHNETLGDLAQARRFNQTEPLRLAERGGTESAPLLFTPDEPFLRVDASLSRRWTRTRDGRSMEIMPFIRVMNGLGDRDALFYLLDKTRGDNEPTALGALPVIPILGLEWKL